LIQIKSSRLLNYLGDFGFDINSRGRQLKSDSDLENWSTTGNAEDNEDDALKIIMERSGPEENTNMPKRGYDDVDHKSGALTSKTQVG